MPNDKPETTDWTNRLVDIRWLIYLVGLTLSFVNTEPVLAKIGAMIMGFSMALMIFQDYLKGNIDD